DADVGRCHRVGDVLVQAGDPGDLHAGTELELVPGHGGTDGHPHQAGLHPVGGQGVLQGPPLRLHYPPIDLGRLAPLEEGDRVAPHPASSRSSGWPTMSPIQPPLAGSRTSRSPLTATSRKAKPRATRAGSWRGGSEGRGRGFSRTSTSPTPAKATGTTIRPKPNTAPVPSFTARPNGP